MIIIILTIIIDQLIITFAPNILVPDMSSTVMHYPWSDEAAAFISGSRERWLRIAAEVGDLSTTASVCTYDTDLSLSVGSDLSVSEGMSDYSDDLQLSEEEIALPIPATNSAAVLSLAQFCDLLNSGSPITESDIYEVHECGCFHGDYCEGVFSPCKMETDNYSPRDSEIFEVLEDPYRLKSSSYDPITGTWTTFWDNPSSGIDGIYSPLAADVNMDPVEETEESEILCEFGDSRYDDVIVEIW